MFSGDELKECIKRQYLTQTAFCEKIKMPRTTLNYILKKGITATSIDNACKICVGLNVPFGELVNYLTGTMSPEEQRDFTEAKKLYDLYLADPEIQPAINRMLGYTPPKSKSMDGDENGKNR